MISVPLPVHRRCAAQRGSALIMVIFLITMLGMIVFAMFNIVKHDAELAISQKQAFRARQVAEMGINWAMNPAIKPYDREFLTQTLPDGAIFDTKIRSEGGKINMNALLQQGEQARPFVTALFRLWGIEDNQQADDLFDNMLDWVDTDSASHHNGMEREDYIKYYNDENTTYPFNRPFYNLQEMTLVPGFEAIAVGDWRDYFTVYSAGKVDMNSAEAKVIAAVSAAIKNQGDIWGDFEDLMKPNGRVQELLQLRWGDDSQEDTVDDKPLQSVDEGLAVLGFGSSSSSAGGSVAPGDEAGMARLIFGVNDQTTRIECTATVGDYRKRVILVVRNRTGQPQILTREEIPIFE